MIIGLIAHPSIYDTNDSAVESIIAISSAFDKGFSKKEGKFVVPVICQAFRSAQFEIGHSSHLLLDH
jgi:hypothetical protein